MDRGEPEIGALEYWLHCCGQIWIRCVSLCIITMEQYRTVLLSTFVDQRRDALDLIIANFSRNSVFMDNYWTGSQQS